MGHLWGKNLHLQYITLHCKESLHFWTCGKSSVTFVLYVNRNGILNCFPYSQGIVQWLSNEVFLPGLRDNVKMILNRQPLLNFQPFPATSPYTDYTSKIYVRILLAHTCSWSYSRESCQETASGRDPCPWPGWKAQQRYQCFCAESQIPQSGGEKTAGITGGEPCCAWKYQRTSK